MTSAILTFHVRAVIIRSWVAHYDEVLREHGLDARHMLGETRRRTSSYQRAAIAFGHAFASLVRGAARQRMAGAR
jgi:hypothetical protein